MIKQSSTYTFSFLMVLTSDHISPATGKTVTVNLSKAGASFAAAAGTVAEIGSGWYKCSLTTADTNTLGDLAINATATACDPTDTREQIVAFNPLAAADLGLTNLDAAVSTRLATSGYTAPTTPPTVAAIRTEMDSNSTKLANLDVVLSTRLATSGYTAPLSVSQTENAVWDGLASSHNTALSLGSKLNAAASAGDPWNTALPGSYANGTAGNIIGNNLNVVLSTRLATSGYTAPPTAIAICDQVLTRDMSAVTGEAQRSPLNALRAIRNKVSRAGNTVTVTKEDDTTAAWTAAIVTDPAAEAIVSLDPA